jgi:hypothetical protein
MAEEWVTLIVVDGTTFVTLMNKLGISTCKVCIRRQILRNREYLYLPEIHFRHNWSRLLKLKKWDNEMP